MINIIKELNEVNAHRCAEVFKMPLESLHGTTLTNMVCAEAGELAGIVHKITSSCYPHSLIENRKDLADEMADVLITLHLVAEKYGINLGEATRHKFNKDSLKKESTIQIK